MRVREAASGFRLELTVGATLGLLWLGAALVPGQEVDFGLGRTLPGWPHLLGTDHAGRDLALRLVLGGGIFVVPALLAAALTVFIGTLMGLLVGYRPAPRWAWRPPPVAQVVLHSLVTVPTAIPPVVVLLLAGVSWGFDPVVIGAVVGVLGAAELADTLAERVRISSSAEFVERLLAEGRSATYVCGYHLGWLQSRGLIAGQAWSALPRVVLLEAALSCLPPGGFGVKEPVASWGNVLARPMRDLVIAAPTGASAALWWNALLPTGVLLLSVGLFQWLGTRAEVRAR